MKRKTSTFGSSRRRRMTEISNSDTEIDEIKKTRKRFKFALMKTPPLTMKKYPVKLLVLPECGVNSSSSSRSSSSSSNSDEIMSKIRLWKFKYQAEEEMLMKINQKSRGYENLQMFCIQKNHSGTREYFSTTYVDFIQLVKTKQKSGESMFFHEICDREKQCKIFMDIDCNPQENAHLDFMGSCFRIAETLCRFLTLRFQVELAVEKNVTFLTACRNGSNSMHIIFDNTVMLKNMDELTNLIYIFLMWMISGEIKELKYMHRVTLNRNLKCKNMKFFKKDSHATVSCLQLKKKSHNIFTSTSDFQSSPLATFIDGDSKTDNNRSKTSGTNDYMFHSLIDMQVYANGSMRVYYSKKMITPHDNYTEVLLKKKEESTRLYHVVPSVVVVDVIDNSSSSSSSNSNNKKSKKQTNVTGWNFNKDFSTEILKKSLLQYNNCKERTSVPADINDNVTVQTFFLTVNIGSDPEKINSKFLTLLKTFYTSCASLLELWTRKNTNKEIPHEMLCFIDMKTGTVDEISKSGIGSGRLQPSGCTDKLSVKKITGPPSETVMNVVEIYRRILNERIKKRTGIIPKIKKVSANSDNTMFVVTIDYTFCLIVRDMRGGSGHTNKGNVGQCDKSVFLIVNTKKRLFYQKCFHDVCRSKKTETWFF